MTEKKVCGCGRAVLEIVAVVDQLEFLKKLPPEPEASPRLLEALNGAKDLLRRQAGMWLEGLRTECDFDKATIDALWLQLKAEQYADAQEGLRQKLVSCAEMTW